MGTALLNFEPPKPPAFLDPLYSIENCYYYAVPAFSDIKHPHTRWLVGRIKANDADAIRRKMEITPRFFKKKYFQVLDNPTMYFEDKKAGGPMYHTKCVLYLTPLGVSLYMKSREVTELMLTYRDIYGDLLIDANEVQFASHMQNPSEGDFHAYPPFLIALRREFFDAFVPLQLAGWQPNTELALPIRRRHERRAFYFRDWMDVALHLLTTKAFYPIHLLVGAVVGAPGYKRSELPLGLFKPPPGDPAPLPIGLVDIGDLPLGVHLTGVESLIEVAEKYSRYLQLKQAAQAIQALKREAETNGYNFEQVVHVAQDLMEPNPAEKVPRSRRLSAAPSYRSENPKTRNSKLKPAPPPFYCSEPVRLLLFCLEKDKRCKSLQQCLDAFCVFAKRGFFLNSDRLPWDSPRSRDQRNLINCLMNIAGREQDRVDVIRDCIRSGKRRFHHVEEHKVLENRRLQHTITIDRAISCLTLALLHSKEIVNFLYKKHFPLYSNHSVDYQASATVGLMLSYIRLGVIREFNGIRNAWRHLTKDMLKVVAQDSALNVYLKVGTAPTKQEIAVYREMKRKERIEFMRKLQKANDRRT